MRRWQRSTSSCPSSTCLPRSASARSVASTSFVSSGVRGSSTTGGGGGGGGGTGSPATGGGGGGEGGSVGTALGVAMIMLLLHQKSMLWSSVTMGSTVLEQDGESSWAVLYLSMACLIRLRTSE